LTEGAKHYSLALELEGPKAEYYFGRAECLSIVGHDDDATLADLDKAISLRPGVADWHDLRAEHLALRHDRYDDALKDLEIVLADDPHDPDALGLRGFIKFNLAQYEEARPDLVAGLDSENEYNARLMLAMIASIQGETDAALGHIETLLAEAPFFWETICEHAHFALLQSHPRFLTLLSAAQEREPALDAAVC
jgi:tetratricopeptide (TPR) repeat protein